MSKLNILVIEDDLILRRFIGDKLRKYGRVFEADSLDKALKAIQGGHIHLAFVDLNLSSSRKPEGLELVKICHKAKIRSVVLTSHESQEMIDQAFERGCSHFFSKKELEETFEKYIYRLFERIKDQEKLEAHINQHFYTQNEELKKKLISVIERQRLSPLPILILGETGVGKTLAAKTIHTAVMKDKPFINKNLTEISENLFESELFGHKKGAFTGASEDKIGLIERAHGGTLFLDEIGTLPPHLQQKLLKVLEEKEFMPLGSSEIRRSDFRLISATCDNLLLKIEEGSFRRDFYFRISGERLKINPLRERREDILPLFSFFESQSSRKLSLSKSAKELIRNYSWPGNIRELKSLKQSLMGSFESYIKSESLPHYIQENQDPFQETGEAFLSSFHEDYISEFGLPDLIKNIEIEAMKKWQEKLPGKINAIAKELQISKSVFYRISESLSNESP